MRIVKHDGMRLAVHLKSSDLREGLNFYSEKEDFLQVGTWHYEEGKHLPPHIHNLGTTREIDRTQEVVYVIHGLVKASIFSEEGNRVATIDAKEGDVLILLAGGHGYDIMAKDTKVLEVKNGPYLGPEKDRRRLDETRNTPKGREAES
jgi:hypothetical protein